jgi:hypothetical protein
MERRTKFVKDKFIKNIHFFMDFKKQLAWKNALTPFLFVKGYSW